MKPIHWLITALAACVIVAFSVTAEDTYKGAEQININGGSRGIVPFNHEKHQEVVLSCNRCHDLFPQTLGSIELYKSEGKLKGKQIMNNLCISCHREKQREGVANAPVSCSQCHQR